jgi:hypothetical protein
MLVGQGFYVVERYLNPDQTQTERRPNQDQTKILFALCMSLTSILYEFNVYFFRIHPFSSSKKTGRQPLKVHRPVFL